MIDEPLGEMDNKPVTQKRSSHRFRRVAGWLLLTSPFTAIAVFMGIMSGWREVIMVWGGAAAIVGAVFAGLHLLDDRK